MRVQSVVLEHHRYISVLRCDIVYKAVADKQLALGDLLKSGDHTQCRRLTASGRTDENKELLILDLEREVGDSGNAARVLFVDVLERKTCHFCVSSYENRVFDYPRMRYAVQIGERSRQNYMTYSGRCPTIVDDRYCTKKKRF